MKLTRLFIATAAFAASLTICSAQGFEAEPNNTIGQANPIFTGVPVSAQLLSSTDVDIFSVTAIQAGGLTIELRWSDSGGRYKINFLNASGYVQASYSDIKSYESFSQTVSVPSAGVYYIQVQAQPIWFSERQYSIAATFAPLVPTITTQPTDQNAITGSTVTFAVTANGIPPLYYQWRKNGVPITGATNSSLRFATVASTDAGTYFATITNSGGTAISSSAVLTVFPLPDPSRFINMSIRTFVYSDNAPIAGFVIIGTVAKRVLVRAIGPTLSSYNVPGSISDPFLTLYNSQGARIGSNDDWLASDASTMVAAGAFPLPARSLDAALVVTLSPGLYTVVVSGIRNATGTVLIEVYDAP